MALQFRRYPGAQVFAFDFGGSIRAAALAMGGDWHDLGGALAEDVAEPVCLQPLARLDDAGERAWAAEWVAALLAREAVSVTPELKEHLWSALTSLASAPLPERTITGLSVLLQSNALKQAFHATLIQTLPPDTGNFSGRFKATLSPTPASVFLDGDYCVTVHNTGSSNAVIAELACVMHNGDDATVIPSGAGADPWTTMLPGLYAPGTAGNILGTNLNALVSTRLASAAYTSPPTDYQQRSQPVTLPTAAPNWYTAPPSDYQQRSQPVTLPTAAPNWYTAPPSDYQQRSQPVTLPATAPNWYTAPPTDYQQRNQAVTLSGTAPSWYAAPPTDYQRQNQAVILPSVAPAWYSSQNVTSTDPWSVALPGNYPIGTAGYAIGTNLDAAVTSRLATSSYTPPPPDYQQRNQPVLLPTSPPSWYSSSSSAPSVAQIVAGVWDEPRAAHTSSGSFGSMVDAAISSRIAADTDTPGTTTLLTRLSSARAACLDNLNVGGMVASHSDVSAIGNNTRVRIFVPDVIQRPASGSITRVVNLYTYDDQGNMAVPDSAPNLSVTDGAGASRAAGLDSGSMTNVGQGHYQAQYTIGSTDSLEQLIWTFTVVQNGKTRQYGGTTEMVDVASADFNAIDRANLNALVNMAGTSGVLIAPAGKSGFQLAPSEHAAITSDTLAALNTAIPTAPTPGSMFDRVDAPVSSRSTYAGGPVQSVIQPVVVGQNSDKSGYALAPSGLDAISIETGVNLRQALSPILAAAAGGLSGAGSGSITIQGGNVTTTRIMAATDDLGNRSSVVLMLPT